MNFFKKCSKCGCIWTSRDAFIHDDSVNIVGYQLAFEDLELGLFLFNHSCGTTIALPVSAFSDLYDGEIFDERKMGSEECPGYCLKKSVLRPCPVKCECAYVREVIQIILASKNTSGISMTGS